VVGPGARVRAALLEAMIPRRRTGSEESLAHFVRRRFGAEILERLAQPLVSGIYGSDAETLSLEATMPRFPTMERERGSIVRALRAKQRASGREESASGARYGLFVALDRGMQVLSDALARSVGDRIRLRTSVRAIEREGARWRVVLEGGGSEVADAVVIATSARRAASMIRDVDPLIHDGLDTLPHGSAATVTFAWKESEIPRPLDAYGFVVPAVERRTILASTWASAKWPGRAPPGWALIRVFIGGMHAEDVADRDEASLIATARRELRALMGIESRPAFSIVTRFDRAMPIYRVGHLERVASLEAHFARFSGLALAGNGLRGVGIPDAIASGLRAATAVALATSA
jgi:oxygen-dependent protoporphyrinogen oxidase